MNEIMLPWPEPRRPRHSDDDRRPAKPADHPAPHYEIQRVNDDGSTGPLEILPITRTPWQATAGRRGFLGAGIASSVAAMLLSGCNDQDGENPATSATPGTLSPTADPSDSAGSGGGSESGETPTEHPTATKRPRTTRPHKKKHHRTRKPSSPPDDGGGVICTCNKVCTCIPVCQAHHLLDADLTVRHMAEITVLAMGLRELPYLRWAAARADAPLRARIEELIADLRGGRRLELDNLADPGCAPYLTSRDPIIAMMAAQVLALRALSLGTGLTGPTAERAAEAMTAGRALHLERAPAWSQ